jgi:hypothetical protein
MRKLTKEECLGLVREGEFAEGVLKAADTVAVVLTQSWCPQWAWMRSYLAELPPDAGREVFWVEYDREDFFEPIMEFKERVLGNDQVPYVRYYRGGKPAAESNYIDKGGFLRLLEGRR